MEQDLWGRSRAIVTMLRAEIDRRSAAAIGDRADIARAVLAEMTPPGWRYQLYRTPASAAPDFILIPAAFA